MYFYQNEWRHFRYRYWYWVLVSWEAKVLGIGCWARYRSNPISELMKLNASWPTKESTTASRTFSTHRMSILLSSIQSRAANSTHNIHEPRRQRASNCSRRSVTQTRNFVGDGIIDDEMNDAERHQTPSWTFESAVHTSCRYKISTNKSVTTSDNTDLNFAHRWNVNTPAKYQNNEVSKYKPT